MIADVTRDGLPYLLAPDANGIHVLVNRRTETNRSPVITPRGVDITIDYFSLQEQGNGEVRFPVARLRSGSARPLGGVERSRARLRTGLRDPDRAGGNPVDRNHFPRDTGDGTKSS